MINQARQLSEPSDYFKGLDWGEEILPREVLAFCRTSQDHRTTGWEGISAKAGRYDQHSRYVFIIALEGEGLLGAESAVWKLMPGKAALLKPYTIHYYVDLPDKFTWLYLTFDLDQDLEDGVRPVSVELEVQIEDFLAKYQSQMALPASSVLGEILGEFQKGKRQEIVHPSGDDNFIGKVKEYIMANLDQDLSIPVIAEKVDVSESYLRAQFRENAGVSLGHFVRSLRLVRSTYLMQEEGNDLAEVAKKSGFNSLTSFTRAFRRMYDMTPSSFRGKNRA